LDPSLLPKYKRSCIIPNAPSTIVMEGIANDIIDLHATQDSLSFPEENSIVQLKKDLDFQVENKTLQA